MSETPRRSWRTAEVGVPMAVAAATAVVSWQRWITPFVDGSREMSVPARIAAGERLYRDVAYYYGPVGPWLGAVSMRIFGARWIVLEALCAIVTAVLLWSMNRVVRRAASPLAALAATTATAALCVGAPLGGAFLFPYSIDFLIAVASGFAALAFAGEPRDKRNTVLAAVSLATTIGARAEVGLAVALLLVVSGLRWKRRVSDAPAGIASTGIAAAGIGLGAVLWSIALAGIPIRYLSPEGPGAIFSPPEEWRRVYRFVAGFDDPVAGLKRVATGSFLLLVVVGTAWLLRRRPRLWVLLAAGIVVLQLFPLGRVADAQWPSILTPFPLAMLVLPIVCLTRTWSPEIEARFLLFGFAATISSRVLLRLTYGQESTPYSILALPVLLASAAVVLIDMLPRVGSRSTGSFRHNVSGIFAVIAAVGFLRIARLSEASRTRVVDTPRGSLRLPTAQAEPTRRAIAYLAARAKPGDELIGFPEAGIFNLTLRLRNPLREEQILPGHLDPFDEQRVVRRLIESRARFVVLVGQPSRAFGRVAFGQDYARAIWTAVRERYRPTAVFGAGTPEPRIGDSPFFIEIFELRDSGSLPPG